MCEYVSVAVDGVVIRRRSPIPFGLLFDGFDTVVTNIVVRNDSKIIHTIIIVGS